MDPVRPTRLERARSRFVPPKSLQEAYERRTERVLRKQGIEDQLGSNNRTHADGRRMNYLEYEQWRIKAKGAMRATEATLMLLKNWIREENERVRGEERKDTEERNRKRAEAQGLSLDDPDSLIRAAHGIFSKISDEGVDFDEDERSIIASLRNYLNLQTLDQSAS